MHNIRSIFSWSLLFVLVMLAIPASLPAQVAVSITIGPPALPIYEQPEIPGPGYIWTPGYWAWNPEEGDYYWTPGTWVEAPEVGFLWTPGYWRDEEGFLWHEGYWGPEIGFYGGINYGFGYVGVGYEGGYWQGGASFYNRSVNNVTNVTTITHVYNKTVVNNVTVNNVSYNGGAGGTNARPTPKEEAAANQRHVPPTSTQVEHAHAASTNREQLASVNHGKPAVAATPKPGVLSGNGVVAAKAAAPYHPAAAPASPKSATPPSPAKPSPNEQPKPAPPAKAQPTPREQPKPVPPKPQPEPKPTPEPKPQQEPKPHPEPKPNPEPPPVEPGKPPSQPKKPEPPPQAKPQADEKQKPLE